MKKDCKQEEQETKLEKTAWKRMILSIVLGVCLAGFVGVDVFLSVTLNQAGKAGVYSEKNKETQIQKKQGQKGENSKNITMSGFLVGSSGETAKSSGTKKTSLSENGISDEEYILPDSDSKYYTKKDLKKLTRQEVKLARNEIYARHGRKFVKDMTVKEYFEGKDWYHGTVDEVSDSELNKYEIANRDLIVEYETDKNWN